MHTCFVDFKKAFDSIWQKALFHKLESNNINGNFLELLKNIYKQSKCAIKINHKLTKLLSSTLFNIYINDLFNEIGQDNIDLVTLNDIDNINGLMFADDLILISTSKTGLQNSLNVLENYIKNGNFIKKTKCITFSKSNHKEKHQFTINNQNLENRGI